MIDGEDLLARGWTTGPLLGRAKQVGAALLAEGHDLETALDMLDAARQQPRTYETSPVLAPLADAILKSLGHGRVTDAPSALRPEPLPYPIWGREGIEDGAVAQMNLAMRLPTALAGALMADAHIGYGLPVGGVFALDNAVSPGAVGPDIGCAVYISLFDVGADLLSDHAHLVRSALLKSTIFGVGAVTEPDDLADHAVLEDPAWQYTDLTRGLRDKAVFQLGQSGSGNHFASVGSFTLRQEARAGVAAGQYVALVTHSGSRAVGYKIADHYGRIAEERGKDLGEAQKVAALSLLSADGQEYWDAMQLAARFATANHSVIHARFARLMGWYPVLYTGNHHNIATREYVRAADGGVHPAIVHRKGATPAQRGVLGFIPGTMADPGFLVRGRGNLASLESASHGAGRRLGRMVAIKALDPEARDLYLAERAVALIGGGMDEAPAAYKKIEEVMAAQSDLVETLGVFYPRVVRMAYPDTKRFKAPKSEGE